MKYEIYIPDRYYSSKNIVLFDDMDSIIDSLVCDLIQKFNLTGVSIRDEIGYYRLSDDTISRMRNKVLYFFTDVDCSESLDALCDELKIKLKQETMLYVVDNKAQIR